MRSKLVQYKKINITSFKDTQDHKSCKVSKASTEIMLDRFRNGKEIDFPFSS